MFSKNKNFSSKLDCEYCLKKGKTFLAFYPLGIFNKMKSDGIKKIKISSGMFENNFFKELFIVKNIDFFFSSF